MLFNTPIEAYIKIPGDIVGIDINGNIFGSSTLRFDLQPIDSHDKMSNVKPLRNDIDKTLRDFVLYGTLGENGKFIVFGAKFHSKSPESRVI